MLLTHLGRYLTRIVPALALTGLLLLLWKSFQPLTRSSSEATKDTSDRHNELLWQCLLGLHIVALHIATALIPLRAFRTLGHIGSKMRETAAQLGSTQASPPSAALRFAIIMPSYMESVETLRTTLDVLASHAKARACYDVYLAMEEREKGSELKAKRLQDLLHHRFHSLNFTLHPQMDGEAPGKSSNQGWAARQVLKDYYSIPHASRPEVLVTTMDADSHVSWRFFAQMAEEHLAITEAEKRVATFYISPIVFDRNAHQVPLLVRSADIFWTGAGLSTMHPGSSTPFPTSVYSLPLKLLEEVGGWDTDYGAIGEDMHMFLKCFFACQGNLRAKVIHAAASQCNVCSEVKGIRGYADGIRARYLQAVRHMWGMLDTGFAIRLAFGLLTHRWKVCFKRPLRVARRLLRKCGIASTFRRPWHEALDLDEDASSRSIHYRNVCAIFCRLAEAHLVPLQVLVAVAGPTIFQALWPDVELPPVIAVSLHLCTALRILGLIMVVAFARRYKNYHQLCARLRAEDITTAQKNCSSVDGDIVQMPGPKGSGLLEAAMSPVVGLLFGALPALQATVLQVFTVRLKYIVSAKPLLVFRTMESNAERGDKRDDLL